MPRYGCRVASDAQISGRWHPRLIEAAAALHENRLDIAERILKPYLKEDPFDVRAIRMLAELAARLGRLKDSETLLRRAVEISPNFTAARANLAMVLGRLGRPAEALELLDDIFETEPDQPGHLNLKAATLGRLGDFEQAVALYEQVLRRAPDQPRVLLSYGHMLKTLGRLDEAVAAYRKAIAVNPALGEAWWSLANLKTVRFSESDAEAMQSALARHDLKEDDRFHLDFALGKAFHDLGRSDDAFAHYAAGNALRRQYHPFVAGHLSELVDRSIELFTAELLATPGGNLAPDPIFVVGMPRAGSTLVEQILSSHSLVEGTSELPDMPAIARGGGKYPRSAVELTEDERCAAGEEYLKRSAIQRRTDRPFFIDKLPNNWMFVPFIHFILPKATIIDARRHPMACCMSNFRQHFARGQDFTYDLTDLGRYYSDYVRLMSHIDMVMPGRVHRVIYERMIDDTEAEVRALLDYCGLEFEPACLEFYNTERAVRTPSAQQVRQPIYRDAADEWRRYEDHLGPLKEALGEVLDAYPQAPASFLQR
ncbi:tetratricopeptide repeat-containing sulfotransferase family protein [Sphingomonas hankyongi]|uniref:Sulfotransferase n=1 Tax=Sphingomonas hankyongi TaxID=2908209 RepID=A0ABT0RXZ0_9SPHN|nr:sulfotransferase [Sphingomonas hankyongi]MCL6728474.1 sulfotransferase [Sphingomonas hankyongi]